MSSVGVFRKVDLDEESCWVYSLAQTGNPSRINLFSSVLLSTTSLFKRVIFWWRPRSSSFLCPKARIRFLEFTLKENNTGDNRSENHPVNSSPHFPISRSGDDQQGEPLLDCDHDGNCKLPVVHLNNVDDEFICGACSDDSMTAHAIIHVSNVEKSSTKNVSSLRLIIHPSHPFHSLRLSWNAGGENCICCGVSSNVFYHCTTCKLFLLPVCAMRSIPFVEDHPKSHPHPLTFFPTQATLACHICGLIKNLDPTYICIDCVFVIHKGCIGFPHVIRISRHNHRTSFTSSLPSGSLSCGVCHQQIDNHYGAYSCSKGEAYFVHSKCALDKRVWDGIDLEGVAEEDDIIDDGEPFKRIADGIILRPFHCHNLQLEIMSGDYDENKYCRGCALPIYEGQFYSCMECDFTLHESCANAPRMKRHPLYPHPLTLKVAAIGPDNNQGIFCCSVCGRDGTGFFHEHRIGDKRFQLDLRCAFVTEPYEYQGHNHPLFLSLDAEENARCQMCKYESHDWTLYCLECDYKICFGCAAFPFKVRYKHDSHFLTICNGKEASDQLEWCEICEGKIEEVKEIRYRYGNKIDLGFYKCDDFCTAIHVECLLGINIYLKPGDTIEDYVYFTKYSFRTEYTEWIQVRILLNNSQSRPICTGCDRRCPFPIVFKGYNKMFCSWDCIGYDTW